MINVLVAVDLCDHSTLTLEVAHALATGARGKLIVLHVVRLPDAPSDENGASFQEWSQMKSYALVSAETALRRLVARIGITGAGEQEDETSKLEVRASIGRSPVDVVLGESRRMKADMIVVGAHERARLCWLFAGAMGRRLQRRAHCPIILVRSASSEEMAETASVKGPRRTPIAAEVLE